MSEQQYTYDGRPGCVMRHRSRATGTTIGIYKADQAGLDGSAGEWIALCEDHNERYAFPNLRHARAHYAAAPWCAACHGGKPPGVPAAPPRKHRGAQRASYVSISGDQAILLNLGLYERLGSPPGLRVAWSTESKRLVLAPATDKDLKDADVYPVQYGRLANGTRYRNGAIYALTPLRQSGLPSGRYQPTVKDDQVILKASYKIEDDQADAAATDLTAEAHD